MPGPSERPWPFAIGLVLTPDDLGGPEGAGVEDPARWPRLAVALTAYRAGFYLLDVVEVAARTAVTAEDWTRLWSLAVQTDAQALFVLGLGDAERDAIEPMATELRLVLREVPVERGWSVPGRSG